MIDRKKIDESIKEAQSLIGQKRVWKRGYGLPDAVVECFRCAVTMEFDIDLDKEKISVAPQIWCSYADGPFGIENVWFGKEHFLALEISK